MSATIPELTPGAAHPRLGDYRVIDVREPHEWSGPLGRVPGSEHLPLAALESRLDALAGEATLLIVCRSGKRSGIACSRLAARGLATATNLAGGMIAWNRAGLPIERDEPRTLAELLEGAAAWLAQVTGSDLAGARARLEVWLGEAGSSISDASPGAINSALAALEAGLRGEGEPPDLDLTLDALRRDLAVL